MTSGTSREPSSPEPGAALQAVPNPHPGRDYEVRCETSEFTCVCPLTGQPDWATVTITYVPDRSIVELKSLKLYLQRYRNQGVFYETVVNRLLDDFVAACRPRRCRVVGAFTPRGGITTVVTCEHSEPPA